ncbi:acyltransferase family protein [Flavobacterium sp. Arc2]|uniref:acyltransferase family protein n=1 Tax=Flavobacterium sp. Arc2 TaxID=3046685 RepID=UPI00352DC28D
MKNIFYKVPTFTDTTWSILAVTRFVLAFIVMYGHLYFHILSFKVMPYQFIFDLGGKAAVMVFLLISGISIGYSYARNSKGFIKRRFLRIYPLYFVAVLFAVFLQYYLGSPYELPNSTMLAAGNLTSIANFLLLQGIASITITYNGPLWSIGVEVFLYLMVPLLMLLRLRYILVITLISMYAFTFMDYDFLYGYGDLIWAWPFLIGFIISAKKQPLFAFPLLGLSIFIVSYQQKIFAESLSVMLSSCSILFILIAMYLKLDFTKNMKIFLNFLGTISYPIYIFHFPLYLLLYHLGVRESYVFIGLVILLSIIINYIFDDWLKKIFWKPLVNKLDSQLNEYKIKSISIKNLKA